MKWIKITDSMPPLNKHIFVYMPNFDIPYKSGALSEVDGESLFITLYTDFKFPINRISHWMFPEPPTNTPE